MAVYLVFIADDNVAAHITLHNDVDRWWIFAGVSRFAHVIRVGESPSFVRGRLAS